MIYELGWYISFFFYSFPILQIKTPNSPRKRRPLGPSMKMRNDWSLSLSFKYRYLYALISDNKGRDELDVVNERYNKKEKKDQDNGEKKKEDQVFTNKMMKMMIG